MKPLTLSINSHLCRLGTSFLMLATGILLAAQAHALTVNVMTKDGTPIGSGYRWLLEEDNTNQSPPLVSTAYSIGLDIHKGHAPAVAAGTDADPINVPDPAQPYFLSVMPDSGYAIGGAAVPAGATTVNVYVIPYAAYNPALPNNSGIPTAQISVLVFEDNWAINNAPDLPNEPGLQGFDIIISDNAGRMMMDAFGNMLGTTYQETCSDPLDPATCSVDVLMAGNGIVRSDINGEALIKYLPPGKYGVQVVPPTIDAAGEPVNWVQTATIEGTPTIDAWVAASEPPLFTEGFGGGGKHVAFGFVNPATLPWAVNPPTVNNDGITPYTGSINGRNVFNHFSRPPVTQGYFPGAPVTECWVALNDAVTGQGLLAAACDDESLFELDGIPPGNYELVTWDKSLIALFGFNAVTVTANSAATGDAIALGNLLSFRWFGTFTGTVFNDLDADGYRDLGETGMLEQAVNIRFRDGTLYQAQPTDVAGGYELSKVFPFFRWLVTEVDYGRFKPTGMTAIVDFGGAVDPDYIPNPDTSGWDPRAVGLLRPQPQQQINPNTGNNLSRTETGPVLTQAMHLFLNQTNIIDWGKTTYVPGENGGISGVVVYDVTRDTDDPAFAAAQDWEPGIPRVQINLYQDFRTNANGLPVPDGKIDDLNHDGQETLADVDNYPLGNFPQDEDIDHNSNGSFDPGDAVQIAYTDSFDDAQPNGCIQILPVINGEVARECYDNYGTWNQVRPGTFDGGFAFDAYVPGGMVTGHAEVSPLTPGTYIVEAANPRPGVYNLVKEEDKNVDFGDAYVPSPQLLPPVCRGDLHTVPTELSLFPGVESIFKGQSRPECDRKQVVLSDADNTGVNFFYYTAVPKAARAVGFANNDLSAEFDPTSPIFGEKAAPAWIPVAFRDWQGTEITRVYTDEFGNYNALLPSTFTVNVPTPTGVSPNMLTLVLNDPEMPDPANPGQTIPDPYYDERYSVSPWTLHYEPGRTTYLDTPLVPVAAFVTSPKGTLDTKPLTGTPVISAVTGTDPNQALVCTEQLADPLLATLIITAASGDATHDTGFGLDPGTVLINNSSANISIDSWTDNSISISFDPALVTGGQLIVVRGDNSRRSETGITVQVADCTPGSGVTYVAGGSIWPERKIQNAIDAANPGDLIVVGPGVYYENVIMWKPVRLQGAGSDQTRINANPNPPERLQAWNDFFIDPAHPIAGGPFTANEAPGIFVIGDSTDPQRDFSSHPALIDGFTIAGSLTGGGIALTSDAPDVQISNNNIRNNQGNIGGGITVGIVDAGTPIDNSGVVIRNNRIASNGGILGPGGIALYAGSDNYLVEENRIVANFSRGSGGGIGHIGLSNDGTIRSNRILFNEVFYGQLIPGGGFGGGVFISGEILPLVNPTLSTGAGSVTVAANLIQGNMAGAGNGGGISAYGFNGNDVANDLDPATWFTLNVQNNIIINNAAALGGGGISLQDVAAGVIEHNTVANNDSTATALLAFPAGNLTVSKPQAAGISASMHSLALRNTGLGQTYSNPQLINNIVWHNHSYFNDATLNGGQGGLAPASRHAAADAAYAAALLLNDPASSYVADATAYPDFWDLEVVGAQAGEQLTAEFSVLSDLAGPRGENYNTGNNSAGDPGFVHGYENDVISASVIDEGGNFISVRFTPLSESSGDYHLLTECSPAIDNADATNGLASDYDGDDRLGGTPDIGADEFIAPAIDPAATFAVLQPNGGELLPAGSSYTLRWDTPYASGTALYDLAYSTGPGAPFVSIDRNQSGICYAWSVPGDIHSNTVRFGVIARDAISGSELGRDFSDAPLTIDVIALQHPNGGEVLTSGYTYSITWTSSYAPAPVAKVGIWYKTALASNWIPVANSADSGRYDWTVPTIPVSSTTGQIALILYDAAGRAMLSDYSSAPFTLRSAPPPAMLAPGAVPAAVAPAPLAQPLNAVSVLLAAPAAAPASAPVTGVELLIPNGGEVLLTGQPLPLLWLSPSALAASRVTVSYSADDGATWQELLSTDIDGGFFEWNIPAATATTEQGYIKIERFDANNQLLDSDRNNAPFSIRPAN